MPRGFGEKSQLPFHAGEPTGPKPANPPSARIKVGPGGRIVIPAAMRERLGVKDGDVVIASMHGEELRLTSMAVSLERARKMIREVIPPGVRLSDELIEDRRREVARKR